MLRYKGSAAVLAALCAIAALAVVGTGGAAGGKLKCFSGAPATCSVDGETVTLDTSDGGYAGAYYTNGKSLGGSPLGSVTFSFQYNCDPSDNSTDCVGGGSPRWSIPINTDGRNNTDEGYAFVDAQNCGSAGVVGPSCPVFYGSGSYASWSAFAAANPTYTIGNALPFVITDTTEPGTTLIFDIVAGSA